MHTHLPKRDLIERVYILKGPPVNASFLFHSFGFIVAVILPA